MELGDQGGSVLALPALLALRRLPFLGPPVQCRQLSCAACPACPAGAVPPALLAFAPLATLRCLPCLRVPLWLTIGFQDHLLTCRDRFINGEA